jgi:drug/metabolite transporter (DMT)-like permease
MSAVVVPAYFIFDGSPPVGSAGWQPVLGLTLMTFLSRLALFLGIKHLGGMQTSLLGLGELFVTIIASYFWLHESLNLLQWIGAFILGFSLLLVGFDKALPDRRRKGGLLGWLRPPDRPGNVPWSPHE